MSKKRLCICMSIASLFLLIVSAVYMTTDLVVLLNGNGEKPLNTAADHRATTSSYLTVQVVMVSEERAGANSSHGQATLLPTASSIRQQGNAASGIRVPRAEIRDPLTTAAEFSAEEMMATCKERQGCYKSSCYATGADAECQPSPFGIAPRRTVDPFLACIDDPEHTDPIHTPPPLPPSTVFRSPPPPLDAFSGSEDQNRVLGYARLQLNAFKHLSAKAFQFEGEWMDWNAQVQLTPAWFPTTPTPARPQSAKPSEAVTVEAGASSEDKSSLQTSAPTAASAYRMRARHVIDKRLRKNVYEIENFCLKPLGGISGFMPNVEHFQGEDDVYTMTLDAAGSSFRHVRSWLQNEVEELLSPPAAFVDTKLLIMPVLSRSDNPGHAFHRMTSLLDIRDSAFSNSTATDVTTAFLMLEGVNMDLPDDTAPNLANIHETAFPQFLHLVTKTHFAVFGKAAVPFGETTLGISASDSRNQPVCFRKAAIYFTCTDQECREARNYNVQRAIAPLYHQRSPFLLRRFVREMQSCVGVVPRSAPNRTSPLVLFPTRSVSRRVVLTPYVIGALAEYLTADQTFQSDQIKPAAMHGMKAAAKSVVEKGRLRVLEMIEHSMSDLVRIYSAADVVIGPYGAGLFLSLFMPKHSVVVEVSHDLKRCSSTPGIDLASNSYCDYAGNADAMSHHHIVATFALLPWWRLRGDYDVVPEVFTYALEAALCILNRPMPPGLGAGQGEEMGVFPAMEEAEALNKRCPFHHRRVQYLQDQHDGNSPGGTSPAAGSERIRQHIRIARMMLKPPPSLRSRPGELAGTSRLQHYFDNPEDLLRAITLPRSRRSRREERNVIIEAPCGITQAILEEALLLYNLLPLTHFIYLWRPHPSAFRRPPSACQPELSPEEMEAMLTGLGTTTPHPASVTNVSSGGPRFTTQSAPGRSFATSLRRCTTLGPNPYGVASMQVHEERQPAAGAEFSAAEWRKKLERRGNAQARAPFSVKRVGSGRQQQRPGSAPLPLPQSQGPDTHEETVFCGFHHFALVSEQLSRDALELVVKHTAAGWKSVLQSN
jgi:hypothetical protein